MSKELTDQILALVRQYGRAHLEIGRSMACGEGMSPEARKEAAEALAAIEIRLRRAAKGGES